jgi:hypothetical protein
LGSLILASGNLDTVMVMPHMVRYPRAAVQILCYTNHVAIDILFPNTILRKKKYIKTL